MYHKDYNVSADSLLLRFKCNVFSYKCFKNECAVLSLGRKKCCASSKTSVHSNVLFATDTRNVELETKNRFSIQCFGFSSGYMCLLHSVVCAHNKHSQMIALKFVRIGVWWIIFPPFDRILRLQIISEFWWKEWKTSAIHAQIQYDQRIKR